MRKILHTIKNIIIGWYRRFFKPIPDWAERRYKELVEKGQECNIDDIEKDIIDRDYRDMHREVSPLVQAEDAVLVESSDMTIEQVVEAITKLVK